MHGVVMKGLKDYVVDAYGRGTWQETLAAASLEGSVYVPVRTYDDGEALALLDAAATVTGTDDATFRRSFGRHLVPSLVETYGVHVDGDWSALELLANAEEYIHEALRGKALNAYGPPALEAERVGEDRVELYYGSDRGLCDLAEGIVYGVSDQFDTPLSVDERACMEHGASRCEFVVSRGE